MQGKLPELKHVYQNHLIDAKRWDHVHSRPDDIVIATPYKCGTTWMQNIVIHLIFQDLEQRSINDVSPWIDCRPRDLEEMLARIEAQQHRRCFKSHLPLDGFPYRQDNKYVVVARDPRDVFMSMWNHYTAYTADMYDRLNNTPGRVGPPMPPPPDDIRKFWDMWINRGWFEWETEGYPHWSNLHHVQTWWNYRHLPNILLVHYNDLLEDLPREVGSIAAFLEIDCSEEVRDAIADLTSFASMKRDAEKLEPEAYKSFQGGAQRFINKGTNGRWRSVLTAEDLAMYDAAVAREMTPDCHRWTEIGQRALEDHQA